MAVLALLLLFPAAGSVVATDHDAAETLPRLTVVAGEDGCPEGRTFCFHVLEENLTLQPGDTVVVTLRNEGTTAHNLHITVNESADPDHQDTPAEAAFANITEVEPGEEANTTVQVPETPALYLWCDRTAHEAAGMWHLFGLAGADPTENGSENSTLENGTSDNTTSENSTVENGTAEGSTSENHTSTDEVSEHETAGNDTRDEAGQAGSHDVTDEQPPGPVERQEDPDPEVSPLGLGIVVVGIVVAVASVLILSRQ